MRPATSIALGIFIAPRTQEDFVFRPSDEARGQKYKGRICAKCGGTVRYSSNTHCVSCNTDGEAKWQRKNRNVVRDKEVRIARAIRMYESW